MASPQKENGHTDIANEIMEAISCTHWSSYEIQIVSFILRKTYGWHKKDDWISLSSFQKSTGISPSNCSRTIKKLISRKIIKKNKKKLGINKNYEEWGGCLYRQLSKQTRGVIYIDNKNLSIQITTKESSKETIQKKGTVNSFLTTDKQKFTDIEWNKILRSWKKSGNRIFEGKKMVIKKDKSTWLVNKEGTWKPYNIIK